MGANLNPESLAEFWLWFEANDDELFEVDQNSCDIFHRLSEAMQKVDTNLTFEFGPVLENGSREFVISAGGNLSSFRSVEAMYSTAPCSGRWNFIRFRQRRDFINDFRLGYGSCVVKASDVHYVLCKDKKPNHVGIILFIDGYSAIDRETWDQIGFLFLDETLGEYDVERHVGAIQFFDCNSKQFRKARPIAELPAHFDRRIGRH